MKYLGDGSRVDLADVPFERRLDGLPGLTHPADVPARTRSVSSLLRKVRRVKPLTLPDGDRCPARGHRHRRRTGRNSPYFTAAAGASLSDASDEPVPIGLRQLL